MMLRKNFLLSLLLLFFYGALQSQTRTALEEEAYRYLTTRDYAKAYAAFDKLYSRYPQEMLYEFNLGVAALYYPEKKDRAIEVFKSVKNKYKTLEAEVYLGKAYHMNYKFDEALTTLRPMVDLLAASNKKEDKDLINDVKQTIMNCENGKMLIENKVIAEIDNIGAPVNTDEIEGVPVITADESVMMYTYAGKNSIGGRLGPDMKPDPEGLYLSDIYISKKDSSGKNWLQPQPVAALNTKGNDAAIAMSPDGLTLFTFFSNNQNEGDIQMSKLNGSEFSPPISLNENINTPDYWEGSCSISADGKYLYFSSERPAGFGGRDIYVSEMVNGDWGPALNLGPKVNTIYDDDAPFIHPDGITLFFSSKGHTSIGGYDIMFTLKEGNDWTTPRSMGIPLNTVEDDSYYVINSKGDKGFFSSTRNAKGAMGDQDIYMVTPGILGEKPVVALLKGTVYGNDKPVEAKIEVIKTAKQENIGPYNSNKESGHYLMALSPGYIYRITVKAEGFNSAEEDFDIENLGTYMEKVKDFYLYSGTPPTPTIASEPMTLPVAPNVAAQTPTVPEPVKETPQEVTPPPVVPAVVSPVAEAKKSKEKKEKKEKTKTAEPEKIAGPCSSTIPDLQPLKGASLNDTEKYKLMLSLVGSYCADNVKFTVQIGAYKHPENYKHKNVNDLGEVSSANYPDDITRFTQKEFKTIKDAEKHRQKVIARGQKDAWIVAFIDGKRYTLEDLIMVDFMAKPVN